MQQPLAAHIEALHQLGDIDKRLRRHSGCQQAASWRGAKVRQAAGNRGDPGQRLGLARRLAAARDITALGGWRAYVKSLPV